MWSHHVTHLKLTLYVNYPSKKLIKKRCTRYIGEIKILSMILVSSKPRTDMKDMYSYIQITSLTGYARSRVNMNVSRMKEFYLSFTLFSIVWIFKTMSIYYFYSINKNFTKGTLTPTFLH